MNHRFVDAVEVALFQLQKQHFCRYTVIYITIRGHRGITRFLVTVVDSRRGTYYNVFHHRREAYQKHLTRLKLFITIVNVNAARPPAATHDGDVHGAVRPFSGNFPLVINISSRLSGRRRLHV